MQLLRLLLLVGTITIAAASAPKPARFTAIIHKDGLSDGNHTFNLDPQGQHSALITGAGHEDGASIHLSQRPRLRPALTISVSQDAIQRVSLHYGEEAFAIPASRLTVRARHTDVTMVDLTLPALLGDERKDVDLQWPGSLNGVSALHSEMHLELLVNHQETTTFTYTLETGIPSDVYDSEEMYDLQPHNSTMLTKFMVQVRKEPSPKLSVWVSRKPIAPDFTLIVSLDGEIFAQANIAHDPTSTDALGFDVDVSGVTGRLLQNRVDLVVHFYEVPRTHVGVVSVENLRNTIEELRADDKPLSSLTLDTDQPRLQLQLQHHKGSGFIGLRIVQPGPMDDVQLSLYRLAGNEQRTLLLREGDDVVPFYPPSSELQYGWDDALPAARDAMTVDGVDYFSGRVEIEVQYNPGKQSEHTIAKDLERWITTNGGSTGKLDLSFLNNKDHSFASRHVLVSPHRIEEGELIARVPYSALVTSSSIERSSWGKMLAEHGLKHKAHVETNNIHSDATKVLQLTVAVHSQLFDESMNFRPYFNTFTTSANQLPPYFTDDEVALFSFEPGAMREFKRMKDLWDAEFATLEEVSEKLPRAFTRDTYFRVRSQVETRLLNMSGELVLAPILDLLTHDDTPNAAVEYNDEAHMIVISAAAPIPAGTPITIDFGHKQKSALDFLIQFGFVPPKAVDAAVLEIPGLGPSYVTDDLNSRDALVRRVASTLRGGDAEAEQDDEDGQALGIVVKAIKARFAELSQAAEPHHPSSRVAKDAAAMLRTEREVLRRHLEQVE
jgi:hypothetical protein